MQHLNERTVSAVRGNTLWRLALQIVRSQISTLLNQQPTQRDIPLHRSQHQQRPPILVCEVRLKSGVERCA